MGRPSDSVRLLVTALVVLAGAGYGAWSLSRRGEPGFAPNFLLLECLRGQQLEDDRHRIFRCMGEEEAVIDRLFRDRLSLAEAAAEYREAFESRPEHLRILVASDLGLSEEELYLRMVLLRAEIDRTDWSGHDGVVARLRAEYEALRGCPPPTGDRIWIAPDPTGPSYRP